MSNKTACKYLNKTIKLLTVFLLVISLFAGCVKEEKKEPVPNSSETIVLKGNPVRIAGTADAPFKSINITGASSDTQITSCGKNLFRFPDKFSSFEKNGVSFEFDRTSGAIRISSENAARESMIVYGSTKGKINDMPWEYLFKFSFCTDTPVTVSNNHEDINYFNNMYYLQICGDMKNHNGTPAVFIDRGDGYSFIAKAGVEYGIRLIVKKGFSGTGVLYPQVEIGGHRTVFEPFHGITVKYGDDLGKLRSYNGETTVYSDDSSVIEAVAQSNGKSEMYNKWMAATGGRMETPLKKLNSSGPVVSFVDDDTSSLSLVKKYHEICTSLNIKGCYAVQTSKLDKDPLLADELLKYETEGFGMLYHCDYQSGAKTNYWRSGSERDLALCEKNFVDGLRKMEAYGFTNYRFWVTPYGVWDSDMRDMAKRHGMECLISYAKSSYITNACNIDRYNIPRFKIESNNPSTPEGLKQNEINTQYLHDVIDACKEDNGWIIITTHANEWTAENNAEERFKEIVKYVQDKGFQVKTVQECFESRRAVFLMNELF